MNQPRLLRILLTGLPAGLILTGIVAVMLHVRSHPGADSARRNSVSAPR